jgi:tetratricopeptide (TPR) repeat protein
MRLKQQYDAQEKIYQEAVRDHPKSTDAYYRLGRFLIDNKRDPERAECFLREAVRLAPECATVHHELGVVLFINAQFEDAEKAFREAIRCDPNVTMSEARQRWIGSCGEVGRRRKEIDKKRTELNKRIIDFGNEVEALLRSEHRYVELAIFLYEERQDHDSAEELLREAVSRSPSDVNALAWLARILVTHRQETCADEAEEYAREAILLAPDSAFFYLLLGSILVRKKDYDGSRAACQEALRCDPECASAHYLYACNACYFCVDYDAAEYHLREAARCDPEWFSQSTHCWNVQLAHALHHLGKVDESELHLREALRISPDDQTRHETYGEFLYRTKGDLEGAAVAIAASERYVKLVSQAEDVDVHPLWKAHTLACCLPLYLGPLAA